MTPIKHKRLQDALVDAAANLRKWRRIARRKPYVRNLVYCAWSRYYDALFYLQDFEATP